jgi:hypothetical protein
MSTIVGGTTLNANKIAPVLRVTEAPNAILATATSVTATNQDCITLDRVISFNMVFTFTPGG